MSKMLPKLLGGVIKTHRGRPCKAHLSGAGWMVRWVVFDVHDLRSSVMGGWPTEYCLLKCVRIPGAGWIAQ